MKKKKEIIQIVFALIYIQLTWPHLSSEFVFRTVVGVLYSISRSNTVEWETMSFSIFSPCCHRYFTHIFYSRQGISSILGSICFQFIYSTTDLFYTCGILHNSCKFYLWKRCRFILLYCRCANFVWSFMAVVICVCIAVAINGVGCMFIFVLGLQTEKIVKNFLR